MQPGMNRKELEKLCQTLDATGCVAFEGEAWLKGWKKSTHSALPEVTINLAEDEEIAPFESATVKKGKVAGQRYKVLFFEINDDESLLPVEPVKLKGGPLSIEAAGLCKNVEFQEWISKRCGGFISVSEENARSELCLYCGVSSRAEIDHHEDFASAFLELKKTFSNR